MLYRWNGIRALNMLCILQLDCLSAAQSASRVSTLGSDNQGRRSPGSGVAVTSGTSHVQASSMLVSLSIA